MKYLHIVGLLYSISYMVILTAGDTMTHKKAFITGITGQDGIYLTELLLKKGYEVHGLVRRIAYRETLRLEHLPEESQNRLFLHYGDVTDLACLVGLLAHIQPNEIYHLAAQSQVAVSFQQAISTAQVTGLGTLNLLEAVRTLNLQNVRIYQASSSEMFGKIRAMPQNELTPFHPRSPYGVAKVYAYWTAVQYRESYGMFVVNGILFNHESPHRGATFVTQKIVYGIARQVLGNKEPLYLGNLDARRDWGYAPEYVEAMWRMLQQDTPEDFVIATGQTATIREFVELVCKRAGIPLVWQGSGLDEVGINNSTKEVIVQIDKQLIRPAEVDILCGDTSKAEKVLGWKSSTTLAELADIMFDAALLSLSHQKNHQQKQLRIQSS
jgi:GDPmannose 4,6-dehydratase